VGFTLHSLPCWHLIVLGWGSIWGGRGVGNGEFYTPAEMYLSCYIGSGQVAGKQ